MPRYVALLRGVSPLNAKMQALKHCFELAGFKNVVTVLSSGNIAFDTPAKSISLLEKKIESAIKACLGREFLTVVVSTSDLLKLLENDPFRDFAPQANEKRVVTFLRQKPSRQIKLPIRQQGTRILKVNGKLVFTTYVPHPKGAVFMRMLEKEFGTEITTRTWETIKKVAAK